MTAHGRDNCRATLKARSTCVVNELSGGGACSPTHPDWCIMHLTKVDAQRTRDGEARASRRPGESEHDAADAKRRDDVRAAMLHL